MLTVAAWASRPLEVVDRRHHLQALIVRAQDTAVYIIGRSHDHDNPKESLAAATTVRRGRWPMPPAPITARCAPADARLSRPCARGVNGHRECPKGLMATTVALCSSVHDVTQRVDRRVAPYLSWRPARSRAPRWLPTPGARRDRHHPARARRGSLCHSMAQRPAGKHVLIAVSLAHLS